MTNKKIRLSPKTNLSRVADKTGQRYGLLTVREFSGVWKGKAHWLCDCDCGGSKTVRSNDLRIGRVKSCGCNGRGRYIQECEPVTPQRTQIHAIFYNPADRRAGR